MSRKPTKARRHAKVENLSVAGINWRIGPAFLIVYATDFLAAAKAAPDSSFAPARAFLVCRALELAFKAFLSLKGCPMEQMVEGPFGHNLASLLAEVEKRDIQSLVKFDKRQRNEIIRSSRYYHEKVLEYPALTEAFHGYPNMPDATILIDAATALIAAIYEPCKLAS